MTYKPVSPGKAYKLLLKLFGAQGWWPVTGPGSALPKYHPNKYGAKTEKERFEICIGAILTQNTSWENVEKALGNLNLAGIDSIEKLRTVRLQRLQKLIKPSGYYNQKSKKLKCFVSFIRLNGGTISEYFNKNSSAVREGLLSVNGIGPETADSIMLYAAGKTEFVVDAYTIRIGQRLGWYKDCGYDHIKSYLTRKLETSAKVYNEFHALFVEMAKNYCRVKPLCGSCPLERYCKKRV